VDLEAGRTHGAEAIALIKAFVWPDDRVAHIARHRVTVEEFEEVCFGPSLMLKTKALGGNPVYLVLGRTRAGRYLMCVVVHFPENAGYPVTARDMTEREKRRYLLWSSK
jgi:uncharacterized protein